MSENKVSCSHCGHDITGLPAPCPKCGKKGKTVHVGIAVEGTGTAGVSGEMKSKERVMSGGKSRRVKKVKFGPSFTWSTGRWSYLHQIIDVVANLSEKTITDKETGKVVYHQKEPLDKHTGRGSDKKKK